jgi:hypothetical protein
MAAAAAIGQIAATNGTGESEAFPLAQSKIKGIP